MREIERVDLKVILHATEMVVYTTAGDILALRRLDAHRPVNLWFVRRPPGRDDAQTAENTAWTSATEK